MGFASYHSIVPCALLCICPFVLMSGVPIGAVLLRKVGWDRVMNGVCEQLKVTLSPLPERESHVSQDGKTKVVTYKQARWTSVPLSGHTN